MRKRVAWLTSCVAAALVVIALPRPAAASIGRADLDGARVNPAFIDEDATGASGDVAVGAGYLFWVSGEGGSITRARVDGTHVDPTFITGLGAIQGLAANDRYLYWGGSSIGRATVDRTEVKPVFMAPEGGADDIAATDSYLYWTSEAGIGRAGLDGEGADPDFIDTAVTAGPPPNPYTEGVYAPTSVAVNGTHAYFTYTTYRQGSATSDVGRAELNGKNVQGILHGGGLHGTYYGPGLAAAYDRFFVSVSSGLADTSLNAFSDSATAASPSSWTTPELASGIAVSGRYVYWTQPSSPGRLNCSLDKSRREQSPRHHQVTFRVWLGPCEQARFRASGTVKVGTTRYRLQHTTEIIPPSSSSFGLHPTRKAHHPIRVALKDGKSVSAHIKLRITDAAGNSAARNYFVQLTGH